MAIKNTRFKPGQQPPSHKNTCECFRCTKVSYNKGMKGYTNSGSFKKGHPTSNTGRTWIKSEDVKGEKNNRWKGGITSINEKIRKSPEYYLWRKAVLERDCYTCVWCGSMEMLEVDHIKPFSQYPELRFAIDNGRVLCRNCHMTTDTYGRRGF